VSVLPPLALFSPSAESLFPSLFVMQRLLLNILSPENEQRSNVIDYVYNRYGLRVLENQGAVRTVMMNCKHCVHPYALYRFALDDAVNMNPEEFPNVLKNKSLSHLPFDPFHGTLGCSLRSILRSRLVRRSMREQSTLDNKYAICMSHVGTVIEQYTSKAAPVKVAFEFYVKAFKRSNHFSSNKYLIAHESWLTLKFLTLISLGTPITHLDDFVTGCSMPEPPHAIRKEDVPDNWKMLPQTFTDKYGTS
jgi:hypothetical protein